MKANKLTPRHAAPVQREINTTSSVGGTGLYALEFSEYSSAYFGPISDPFAGDDAE